ncbi:MAG: polyphosphate polymerase domain-containing protein [Bacteroidetes bacterium]|nr:polyphosphate polymerase domain-containing protein [Bacteroidota bacterium]
MDGVSLMNRTDTKFIFRLDQLTAFLSNIKTYYRILEINGIRSGKYETLYFDTPDFFMYQEHHRGKSSRYKVRHRIYVDSNLHYLEIKFKNNKGRTIKNRIKRKGVEQKIKEYEEEFLTEHTHFNAQSLFPKLWSNCSRITLVNKYSKERLTLDIHLQFKNNATEKNLTNVVIAEVKQEKLSYSPFIQLMKKEKIRSSSISKYCYGVITLYDQIKKNNFKQKLLTINKINNNENKH